MHFGSVAGRWPRQSDCPRDPHRSGQRQTTVLATLGRGRDGAMSSDSRPGVAAWRRDCRREPRLRRRPADWSDLPAAGGRLPSRSSSSLRTARSSILRTHSRVTPSRRPISLSVSGNSPSSPYRSARMARSRRPGDPAGVTGCAARPRLPAAHRATRTGRSIPPATTGRSPPRCRSPA